MYNNQTLMAFVAIESDKCGTVSRNSDKLLTKRRLEEIFLSGYKNLGRISAMIMVG